jgi:hypothetical protein
MPDYKFRQKADRNYVLLDAKQRIIDMMENGQQLPDVGIYDEPVRYFKANEQWCKIIFGWLDWLEDVAGWPEAEDDNYPGIQAILEFEEGIEMATKEDIRDGMYEAMNRLAAQIVSGRYTNIVVDGEGNVSDPSEVEAGEDLPDDDPATPDVNENSASRYGAMLSVAAGINGLLSKLNTLYGADVTPDTSLADAIFLISFSYVVENTIGDAMAAYWDARAQGDAQITSLDREDLADYMYCKKFTDSSVSSTQFVALLIAPSVDDKQVCIGILNAMEETQWHIWENTGSKAPSTEYKNAPCEPVPDFELLLQWGGGDVFTPTLKANHRYTFDATGFLQDTDGDIQDAWNHKQTGQPAVYDNGDFFVQVANALKVEPTQNEAAYRADHHYIWTLDMGATNGAVQLNLSRDTTMSVASTSPTNGLLLKVHDLGLIV